MRSRKKQTSLIAFLVILCLIVNVCAAYMRASEKFLLAFDAGKGQYLINSSGGNYVFTKQSTGTFIVNVSKNASNSDLAISLTETSGNIVDTKFLSGTGSCQFLNIPAGSYYVYIWNDSVSTVVECNVYY